MEEAVKYLGFPSFKHIDHDDLEFCDRGRDPVAGFDCSGFVYFLLREIGYPYYLNLRHSYEMIGRLGEPIHLGAHQPGDLIFFSRHGVRVTHVGVIFSDEEYIHAPGSDNTRVTMSKIVESLINIKKIKEEDRQYVRYLRNPAAIQRLLDDPDKAYFRRKQWLNLDP